jgi:aminopeptidase N
MHEAGTASRRIGCFRAFVDIARSREGRTRLKDLLAGRDSVPGVELRSRDRFSIIETLLAAGDPDAEGLLEAQARSDPSAEGRRYAFGVAAARADGEAKRALLRRFLEDRELPESWIEEALSPLNDLDQAPLTRPLLGSALEALPRLKFEHSIFFVNDWLAAFLGGQSSRGALETAKRFVARAKLDRDLRLKVLEALDVLERTVKIRERFSPA